ncbi:MAG: phage holin family protein [Armatimonadota bacterium]|nr:phage holin family protein [Armatimonadota bacterium]MDR5698092.1 phage holin family protein [Armatimonadota bacterium]
MAEEISVSEEWRALVADLRALASKHAALVREEVQEAAGDIVRAGAWIAVGAVAALAVVLFVPVVVTIVLSVWLPTWAAALLATAAAVSAAGASLAVGVRRLRRPKMRRTRLALREDRVWIRDLIDSLRRFRRSGRG